MTNENTLSIDSILDMQLDNLADLPEFLPFPVGVHNCTLHFEEKKLGTHPAVSVKLTLIETLEMADPSATPLSKGATTDVAYMLDNVYGQGALKKLMAAIQPSFPGTNSLRELLREANGVTCNLVTRQTTNKAKTATYTDIVEAQVA